MSITATAARGVAWNMLFGIGSRVLQLVGTLLLTRFIAPEAYGAVLGASIATVAAGTLTSFAFGQYLIANRSGPAVSFQAMVIHVALGILTMGVVVGLSHPLAAWLGTPSMAEFMLGFAIAHVVDRIRYVPERLLMRELRFRTIATINGCSELLFTAVALALAPRLGAYAIMAGAVARSLFSTVAFLFASPREQWLHPTRLDPATARAMFGYGLPVLLTAVADRAATRWDSLLMSKLFGPGVMAHYNLSYSLAEMPISSVAEHIGEVLMPAFSAMDDVARRIAVVRSAALMALVVSPLGVGLAAVAPNVVAIFFDARWAEMAPMLVILSIMTVFRPITWPAIAYLQAISQTRLIMYMSIARAILVLTLVWALGTLGGHLWATFGACAAYAIYSLACVAITGSTTGLSTYDYLVGVTRPLFACVPMFLATMEAGNLLLAAGMPRPLVLGAQIGIGAITYAVGAYVFARPATLEFIRLALSTLRRRQPAGIGTP